MHPLRRYEATNVKKNVSLPTRSSKDKHEREHEDRDRKSRSSYVDTSKKRRRSRWSDDVEADYSHAKYPKDQDGRMTKTLDGKTAGLQDAKALQEETEAHKRRETELFNKVILFVIWNYFRKSNYPFTGKR